LINKALAIVVISIFYIVVVTTIILSIESFTTDKVAFTSNKTSSIKYPKEDILIG